jgi:NAD(P)-binding Rossmann-like domain/Flavin containing amine oxidoreductase
LPEISTESREDKFQLQQQVVALGEGRQSSLLPAALARRDKSALSRAHRRRCPSQGAPKLKVAIVGSGLAALSTAVELLDQGYEVDIYEQRPWIGGKGRHASFTACRGLRANLDPQLVQVAETLRRREGEKCTKFSAGCALAVASFKDKAGNHIEMGLHVFFGCYFNLFRLMAKCGVLENLLLKDHTHTFVNTDGDVRELDFRFFVNGTKIGAPFHGDPTRASQPNAGSPRDRAAVSRPAWHAKPMLREDCHFFGGGGVTHRFEGISGACFATRPVWGLGSKPPGSPPALSSSHAQFRVAGLADSPCCSSAVLLGRQA